MGRLAGANDVENITEIMVREQFFASCPKDLVIHLKESSPTSLDELSELADRYLVAHARKLSTESKPAEFKKRKAESSRFSTNQQCYSCSAFGHRSSECSVTKRRCHLCNQFGHMGRFCSKLRNSVNERKDSKDKKSVGTCAVDPDIEQCSEAESEDIEEVDKLELDDDNLPVVEGFVGNVKVNVLRDTGCTAIVVDEKFVKPAQYLGSHATLVLLNGTRIEVQRVKIVIDTPYLSGEVKAYCMKDCIYDLVIGNVKGVETSPTLAKVERSSHPDMCAVTTRAQAKKQPNSPLNIKEIADMKVDKEDLVKLQSEDESLGSVKRKIAEDKSNKGEWFELKSDILYRFVSDEVGRTYKQLVVPKTLRRRVMEQAHCSIMGGHLGITKTKDRICSSFYWPGMHDDVSRFCRSCDICQKNHCQRE